MERGVQRALFDLQHVFGTELDRFGNRVTVGRASLQGAQDQQVQRPLQKLYPILIVSGRHPRCRRYADSPRMSRRELAAARHECRPAARSSSAPCEHVRDKLREIMEK